MLTLSDHQLQQVQLRSMAGRLSAIRFPTDYDVSNAVNFVLGCRGIAVGHARKEKPHAFR